MTQCSGWLTYRPGQGSGPPAGSRPGPLTRTVVTSCYPAAGPMHYGHPDAGRAQDMGPMYQEAPAAPSSGPSSSLPTLPRASTGAQRQSGRNRSSPWVYTPPTRTGARHVRDPPLRRKKRIASISARPARPMKNTNNTSPSKSGGKERKIDAASDLSAKSQRLRRRSSVASLQTRLVSREIFKMMGGLLALQTKT